MSDSNSRSFVELCEALDPKEQAFVDEYLECLNATLAARRVYGHAAAKQTGYKLLRRPDVATAISAGLAEQRARTVNDPDRIIRELMVIAYADLQDLLDEQGRPLALRDLSPELRRAIASIKTHVTETGATIVEYKLVDKKGALELLGKRNKMWTDRKEIDAGESLSALIAAAINRPKASQPGTPE